MHQRIKAFSLVELSIVLVILGLLVGGVLSGRSLIRSSELRAITAEKDKYIAAVFSFRDAYSGWPGDLPDAYRYWGAACGTDATTSSTGCNGNGDGLVHPSIGENLKAWEHLARGGFIEGRYDGSGAVVSGYVALTANNIPASKFPQSYWNVSYSPVEASILESWANGAPLLAVGAIDGGAYSSESWLASLASLTLSEAFAIDTKTDDGRSDAGKVGGNHDGMCADSPNDPYSMIADGADTAGRCIMVFMIK